jgi:hypothetical protein
MSGKRGQLTLFIIIGIVILVVAGVMLYFFQDEIFRPSKTTFQVDSFESCVKKELDGLVVDLAKTGGFTGSYFNVTYNNVAIPYMCYTEEYSEPCVVQVPFQEKVFQDSIRSVLDDKINLCYNNYVSQFQRQGYDVQSGEVTTEIDFQKDYMRFEIDAPVSVSDGSSTSSIQKLSFNIPTKIYDIISLANNIVAYETTYGAYDLITNQFLYPEMPTTVTSLDDGTVIYTIVSNDIKYRFAVRSYVLPAGYQF